MYRDPFQAMDNYYNWNNMPNMFFPVQSMQTIPMLVPQRPYVASMQRNDIGRIPAVLFNVNGSPGICLAHAQVRNLEGLVNPDDRPLTGFGVKVTYRIEWPGYTSFNRQKHALRGTREKQSITRAKMAVHVAEVMKDFIEENATLDTTDPTWRVGSHGINLGDLYLLEIHQVAKASLQPVIAYRPSNLNQTIWG